MSALKALFSAIAAFFSRNPSAASAVQKVATPAAAAWLAIGVTAVGAFEGLRTTAYLDPVGIPTVCFGETEGVRMGDTYTKAECEAMLADRLVEFDRGLARCLPQLPNYHPETRAALVSWAYNVGVGAACNSTLVRIANQGDLVRACDQLSRWTYATKAGVRIQLPGLVKRRAEERQMCLKGAIPA